MKRSDSRFRRNDKVGGNIPRIITRVTPTALSGKIVGSILQGTCTRTAIKKGITNAIFCVKMALVLPILHESVMTIIQRYFQGSDKSYFLLGARGTGKSTYLHEHYKDALWIDLLNPEDHRQYMAYPERLRDFIKSNLKIKKVVIDEIQRVPQLLPLVHAIIEEKRGYQFILTGSSSRKIKRTGSDLLAGRALHFVMHPFMAAELDNQFSLDKSLQYGLLPIVYMSNQPKDVLNAYVHLYLHEEIQAEGMVRQLDSFSRFLEAISFSHASILNITNVARECSVKRKSVENYINILEELLLAYQIPVFSRRAKRDLVNHPKFYLFDAGVFNILRPKGLIDNRDEIEGIALEGLVAQHLKAWADYSNKKHQIYYWKTRTGIEVDFIIYGEENFVALEVKNSKRIHPSDLKGLKTFLTDYPQAKAVLVYRGKDKLMIDDVLCLPIENFLKTIIPNEKLLD